MPIAHQVEFIRRYIESPQQVGAVLPSSRRLSVALAAPYAAHEGPARVLEVGAGTGAVTRVIGELLGPQDRLDVCEIQPRFVDILDQDVLSSGPLASARREGRVRLLTMPVEEINAGREYDFIISCLPFTAFNQEVVEGIFEKLRQLLTRDGMLSYFEYIGLRRLSATFTFGRHRAARRHLSAYLNSMIRQHQEKRVAVWRNVPPAVVRHLSF